MRAVPRPGGVDPRPFSDHTLPPTPSSNPTFFFTIIKKDLARKLGFTELFPALESVLSRAPATPAEADSLRPCVDYLHAVSALNQTLVMAQQLQVRG